MKSRIRFGSSPDIRYALVGIVVIAAQACAGRIHPTPAPRRTPPEQSMVFVATAYCAGSVTAAGTTVADGIVAADPVMLPIGTVIKMTGGPNRYNRIYTVMDTGPKIQGHRVDLYVASCAEARRFGRRSVRVTVLGRNAAK